MFKKKGQHTDARRPLRFLCWEASPPIKRVEDFAIDDNHVAVGRGEFDADQLVSVETLGVDPNYLEWAGIAGVPIEEAFGLLYVSSHLHLFVRSEGGHFVLPFRMDVVLGWGGTEYFNIIAYFGQLCPSEQ